MAELVLAPPVQVHPERKGAKKQKDSIWIVLHTTEGHEGEKSAEALALACTRQGDRTSPETGKRFGSAYHYVLDIGQVIPLVPEDVVAFSARDPANQKGIHIVFPGFARQNRDEWLDVVSSAYIDQCVLLVRDIHQRTSIPLVKRTVDEVKANESGLIDHKTVTDAFKKTDHQDVGPGFPWDVLADRIAAPGPVVTRTRRTTNTQEDDVPIAIKFKDADPVFTVNGMIASFVPTGEIYNALLEKQLVPPAAEILQVDRLFFKSLRLVGEIPSGFTAEDFHSVG